MEKNKKIFLGIGIGVLVIGLLIATAFIGPKEELESVLSDDPNVIFENAERESASIKESQMKKFETINMSKYLEYYNDSKPRIVFVGRPTCPYSELSRPIIGKLAKDYNIEISYLNTDELTDSDKMDFMKHNELFNEGFGTPILLVVSEGEIKTYLEGSTDTAHFKEFFKSIGLIK